MCTGHVDLDLHLCTGNSSILKEQIKIYKDKDVDKVREQMQLVLKELTGQGQDGEKKGIFGSGISQEQF